MLECFEVKSLFVLPAAIQKVAGDLAFRTAEVITNEEFDKRFS